jgi:membrane protein implicated in regulation of membrane protease activity
MQPYLTWLLIGFGLIIVELLTGTFYLLMLGIAAFGAAAVAYFGQGFEVQVIVAVAVASAGCYGVHVYRAKHSKQQMASVDAGQPANFESWIDQGGGLARVRYRGASWDARVDGQGELEPGALLYVKNLEAHTLYVSRQRPA